jgi:hypothetical protein
MQNSTILGIRTLLSITQLTANAPWPRTSDFKAQVQGVGGKAPAVTAFQQPRGAAPLLENHPQRAGTWLGAGQGSIGIHVLVHVELVEGVRQNITQGVYFSNTCRAPTSARCSKASHQVSSTLQKPNKNRGINVGARPTQLQIKARPHPASKLRMLSVTSPLRRFKRCDVGRLRVPTEPVRSYCFPDQHRLWH